MTNRSTRMALFLVGAAAMVAGAATFHPGETTSPPRDEPASPRTHTPPPPAAKAKLRRVHVTTSPVRADLAPDEEPARTPDPSELGLTLEECASCIEATCSREVAEGGHVGTASCLLLCSRRAPEAACLHGMRPPMYRGAASGELCGGPTARSPQTLALMRCGAACDC